MDWKLTDLKKFAKKVQELISDRSFSNIFKTSDDRITSDHRIANDIKLKKVETENNEKELQTQCFKLKEFNLKSMINQTIFNQNLFTSIIKSKWLMAMLFYAFRKRLLKLRYYFALLAWFKRRKILRALQNRIEAIEDESFVSKVEKLSEYQKNPRLFVKEELLLDKATGNPELFFNFILRQHSNGVSENAEELTEKLNDLLGVRENLGESPNFYRKSPKP